LGAKWNAQAMVARACELRGKPFSDTARPKETKAAQKLFDRKPDLTLEEFEKAWKQWNTQWWRETNGLFNLTDLAAVPKNKSEMRLIIALEKLALPKARDQGKKAPVITIPNQPITNIRELVRQREALRAAAAVSIGV
jgi:hypothetical protein